MLLDIFGKCNDIFKETLNKLKDSDRRVEIPNLISRYNHRDHDFGGDYLIPFGILDLTHDQVD